MLTGTVVAAFFGLLYIVGRYIRRFFAWGTGNDELIPREKVVFALPIILAMGFVSGWLFEPAVGSTLNQAFACNNRGTFNVPCLLGWN